MGKTRSFLALFLILSLLFMAAACGRIDADASDDSKDEISYHTREPSETPTSTPEKEEPVVRRSLSDDQIESIAYDLASYLSLFQEGEVRIGTEEAELFALNLIFCSGQDAIRDHYISDLDGLIDSEKTQINDSKVDGEYVKVVANAIFGVDFEPDTQYEYPIGDPAPFGMELISVKEVKGNYLAVINFLDLDGSSSFASMYLHLHLTYEGNTRIDSIVISESEEPEAIENTEGVLTRDALESQYYDLQEYDFNEDGIMELAASEYDGYGVQQLVFAKHNGTYQLIFDKSYMDQWNDYLRYDLQDQVMTCHLMDKETIVSVLPDRLFCHKEKESDHLQLLKESTIVTVGEKAAVLCSLKLCMPIGGGDYGPNYSEYKTHYCELIRVDFMLQYNGGNWDTVAIDTFFKYGTEKETTDPVGWNEYYLGDHVIEEGGDVRETIVRLGGRVEDYDSEILDGYKECINVGGVRLDLFSGGMICGFSTASDQYPTSRGLKVGDTRDIVRKLYGEPDTGFLDTDGAVFYYMWNGDSLEEMQYKSSREFYILFDGDTVSYICFRQFCDD